MSPTPLHERLEYRFSRPEDRPSIEQLWENETDWGRISNLHWAKWYEENPYGHPLVTVATDGPDGEVVGQFVFLPSLVSVHGRIVSACRLFAPILKKDDRVFPVRDFMKHPVAQLFYLGMRAMRERGVGLFYMMPLPEWMPILEKLRLFRVAMLPDWKLPLPLREPFPVDAGYAIGPLVQSAGEIDALWEAAAKQHDCVVVRDSGNWAWRVGRETLMAVTHGGELAAIFVYRVEGRRNLQWMVRDLLFAGDDTVLRNVLAAICNFAREQTSSDSERQFNKIASIVPRALENTLRGLGFVPDDYMFPLAVQNIDPSIADEDVAPERWFVSAND